MHVELNKKETKTYCTTIIFQRSIVLTRRATLKTNYDNLHGMTLDELVTWIDKHGDFDGATWMTWFDKNYCKKCESIQCDVETAREELGLNSFYGSGVTCAYCELHHNCKFFPDLHYIPNNKDIIRMWLELEADDES